MQITDTRVHPTVECPSKQTKEQASQPEHENQCQERHSGSGDVPPQDRRLPIVPEPLDCLLHPEQVCLRQNLRCDPLELGIGMEDAEQPVAAGKHHASIAGFLNGQRLHGERPIGGKLGDPVRHVGGAPLRRI